MVGQQPRMHTALNHTVHVHNRSLHRRTACGASLHPNPQVGQGRFHFVGEHGQKLALFLQVLLVKPGLLLLHDQLCRYSVVLFFEASLARIQNHEHHEPIQDQHAHIAQRQNGRLIDQARIHQRWKRKEYGVNDQICQECVFRNGHFALGVWRKPQGEHNPQQKHRHQCVGNLQGKLCVSQKVNQTHAGNAKRGDLHAAQHP